MNNRQKKLEQYLFNEETINYLIDLTNDSNSLCLISTPSIAEQLELKNSKKDIVLLEIDEKFEKNAFFKKYDINSMEIIEKKYDFVIFDPPAMRFLPKKMVEFIKFQFLSNQKIILIYPDSFFSEIDNELKEFKFKKIDKKPIYKQKNEFNIKEMRIFTNFESCISKSKK
jgi:hypothetical protein